MKLEGFIFGFIQLQADLSKTFCLFIYLSILICVNFCLRVVFSTQSQMFAHDDIVP